LWAANKKVEARPLASKGKDRNKGIEGQLSRLGNPLLGKATASIECERWREYDGGDHAISAGAVKNLIRPAIPVTPMIYHRGKMGALAPIV
ncbi:flavin reductase, partial [Pseudomonas syringae]|uniref:flavin reductase family protein n=1 Tax=Pseudomonas syringae TaxID=317 RepID=UPI001F474C73